MKTKRVVITTLGIFIVIASGTFGTCLSGDQPDDFLNTYSKVVDDIIAKCRAKADHLDSKSPRIRRMAVKAVVKGAYLRANKSELVKYLAAIGARPHPAEIQFHLNCIFYDMARSDKMYAVLFSEHPFPR